jgi:hypothetical protein
MISELNGWPSLSSVNASPIPSRESAHDSKPNWFAIPSFVQNLHLLLSSDFYRRFPCPLLCAHGREKYGELREATPPPAASESEAALEVTDQEVKFRIGSKLWEKGVTFEVAINRLKADIVDTD